MGPLMYPDAIYSHSPLFIHLAIRSIRSARDCARCVQLTRLSLYSSRLGQSDQREIVPDVYSSLAFLYTARDSVNQISARLCQMCTVPSPFSIQLATRSIRSARDCASCVQLARLSLYSSRLGLSDQREIVPAVYSSMLSCGPANDHPPKFCLPA